MYKKIFTPMPALNQKRANPYLSKPLLKRNRRARNENSPACAPIAFECLPADTIVIIASFLDPCSLAQTLSAADRFLRKTVDESHIWEEYFGADLTCFLLPVELIAQRINSRKLYAEVKLFLSQFRNSSGMKDIRSTQSDREVVYLNGIILVDHLRELSVSKGVYVEITVRKRSDNLSFCLVDFDGEGTTSLTFSPDAGAVIRETQTAEDEIIGEYAAVLRKEKRFGTDKDSKMAVFVSAEGEIVFMRYFGGKWESTGTVSDCTWVRGGLITPCLAFKDAGQYHVKIEKMCICDQPPYSKACPDVPVWKPLLWEIT